jgi:hypothetical protein
MTELDGVRRYLDKGALHIPVTPTNPPSQCAHVLGVDLPIGPEEPDAAVAVLVGIDSHGVQAIRGVPERYREPLAPAPPAGFSPLAIIRLLPAQLYVQHRDIEELRP